MLSPYVCGFKFHFDICRDVDFKELHKLSLDCEFVILRDRKYGDVQHINQLIEFGLPYFLNDMIQIVHGFIDMSYFVENNIAILVVLEMSESNILSDVKYRTHVLESTKSMKNVIGYIGQHKWNDNDKVLVTPGIKTIKDTAIVQNEGLVILGRAILEADDPVKTLIQFNEAIKNNC